MKILQVITSLHIGGAEMLVVNMTRLLREKGHIVDVCVFNGEDTPLMEKLKVENPDIKIWKLGGGYYNPLYIIKLARLMKRYDIVHTHNSSPQLFVALAKVLCSVELCSTEHNTSNRKRGWKWYAPIESWMYNQYHHIICISKIAEEKLREYMGGEWLDPVSKRYAKVSTINNGIDVNAFYTAESIKELKHKNRFITVMVAGFREAKDQDTLIKAIALLPSEYELWLVGDGERRSEIESLIARQGVAGRVKMLGIRSDVPQILKSSDVVVMSSHWEGLSLSNIEGMSSGKPFVASDVNGLREVTQDYGILFPHKDVRALATIIRRLHDDKEYYQEVAQKCYERALQFDISNTVEGYNNVYKQVASNFRS